MSDAAFGAVSALVGAAIGVVGGLASSLLVYRQTIATLRAERKRHLLELGVQVGLKEHEFQAARAHGMIGPPQIFALYSARFLQLEDEGKMTPEALKALEAEQRALWSVLPRYGEKG